MPPVPSSLAELPWGTWLETAPNPEAFDKISHFKKAFDAWIKDIPGDNAPLHKEEVQALVACLSLYENDLLEARLNTQPISLANLGYAFASLSGAIFTGVIAVTVGLSAAGIASIVMSFGLGLVGYFLAIDEVAKGLRNARRDRILASSKRGVRRIVTRFWS